MHLDKNESKIKRLLGDINDDKILNGLNLLGCTKNRQVDPFLISVALDITQSGNSEIKEAGLFALCIHLQATEAFQYALEIVKCGKGDAGVLSVAAQSMAVYQGHWQFDKVKVLRSLARIVLDEEADLEVRATSYRSTLEISGKVKDMKKLASISDDVNEIDLDREWLEKIAE